MAKKDYFRTKIISAKYVSLKDTLLLFLGSSIGIIGSLLGITHMQGADFVNGLGAGVMLVFCINVLPKLIKRKNETIAK
jgi:ABC-type transport system involved in multi-copper enzyme maturation permease subunit